MIGFNELVINNKDPVYIQITSFVKRRILSGEVKSGVMLPSRRELASRLNVNPNTVQKAYKLMEDEGFLRTNANQGSFLYVDKTIISKITKEWLHEEVKDFVIVCKDVNLTFKQTLDLISELWDEV